ncbi:hypothetical protein O181_094090 [Austropuccinia psidii MF-1]|uniref:Uncharacterized protein n=1 Tax=Austropuccinia psidii MF-1 TaxID=1389203 RepID=A0A9Q3PAR2_9BASI|nr:hypothetical protein [Austropuccinia psidii MF-1]
MPIISEPELELSMSDSNRDKSHSEGSNRHLHEPVQVVLHSVQRQGLGNVATNTPRSDELLAHPQKIPQIGGNSEILQWMESTIIKTSNQKDQGIPCQTEGGNQGRSRSSFYQQAPSQPTSPRREEEKEKELEKTTFPKLQDSKNLKRGLGKCFQHGQKLDGIQGQGGEKNEKTSFPKEITLSPDVVNTSTEIENSLLPLKEIKNSFLSLQETNNNLSSLAKSVVQNKNEIDNIKFIVENDKPKVLIDNTQKLIQVQQELYKYIKDIKDKTLTINYDKALIKKASSHQKLLLHHVEKSDEARMNLKDDIQSELRLVTENMDKINEAHSNMPNLSTPFSHIRSPVKPKEEMTNPFITELSHQDNNKVLIKEARQLKEWLTFPGEGEYDHMSFVKIIGILQEDDAIPDELITARLQSLFVKSL